jgi:molybdopterin molybdotransferase
VKEAVHLVTGHSNPIGIETVALEAAHGRILAEPLLAKHDVPPFNRSAYDGYAIRSVDSSLASVGRPAAFTVLGNIGAGHVAGEALGQGEAFRIMTGAILPENADAIVMLEDTTKTEQGFEVARAFSEGENISFQGEDAKSGDVLLETGATIHAGTIALLATFGYSNVEVAKRPKVSLISTGTELLQVSDKLELGKIRNSNGPMLEAQLLRMGIRCQSVGMMEDDLDACTVIVEEALEQSDIMITTGGVSVGDFDYLPEIYRHLGAKVLFNKVMMRPGSVTTVAVLGNKLLFGLSGNPSACFTGFELFTRPAILSMMGSSTPYLPLTKAILAEDFPKANPFTRFLRASWTLEEGKVAVRPAGFNKSNAVSSIARGNCLLVLPSGSAGYQTGDVVDILLLGQEQGVTSWDM